MRSAALRAPIAISSTADADASSGKAGSHACEPLEGRPAVRASLPGRGAAPRRQHRYWQLLRAVASHANALLLRPSGRSLDHWLAAGRHSELNLQTVYSVEEVKIDENVLSSTRRHAATCRDSQRSSAQDAHAGKASRPPHAL